eukprot:c17932_g1_i3.p1 GENE.c17932_g1_i3~~c17932_g1_i3.p1  ORF type:complete len:592 (+),score=131.55 c17932_g1_i3:142-1776(+)
MAVQLNGLEQQRLQEQLIGHQQDLDNDANHDSHSGSESDDSKDGVELDEYMTEHTNQIKEKELALRALEDEIHDIQKSLAQDKSQIAETNVPQNEAQVAEFVRVTSTHRDSLLIQKNYLSQFTQSAGTIEAAVLGVDLTTEADIFVQVFLGSGIQATSIGKTAVVKKAKSATFKEAPFSASVNAETPKKVSIQVSQTGLRSAVIGSALVSMLNLVQPAPNDGVWLDLKGANSAQSPGRVLVRMQFTPEPIVEVSVSRCEKLMAVDSNGKSDPYAKVMLGSKRLVLGQTNTVHDTTDPVFDKNIFRGLPQRLKSDEPQQIQIKFFDEDFGRDDELGESTIDISGLQDGQVVTEWHHIKAAQFNLTLSQITPDNKTAALPSGLKSPEEQFMEKLEKAMKKSAERGMATIEEIFVDLETGQRLRWDLTQPDTLQDMATRPFILKQGSSFKLGARFRITGGNVEALTLLCDTRKSDSVLSSLHRSREQVIGNFSPTDQSVEWVDREGDETPSGIAALGSYQNLIKFVNVSGDVFLECKQAFEIKKDWQ